ncbi:TPA: oligosaccharide repeat unit polymerase [Vibrio vulnificus]|uniref:Oligosaccharide repeat unit polymerase n=1 Tax=Vibrio vulnificus TaxID=672 RepID=A0A8H9N4H7_VIBVL|nr:oligosaccharide repeat unit polymerase [Vibrio vulnificus]
MRNNKQVFFPLKIFHLYLLSTLFLYLFGPVGFEKNNVIPLVISIIFYQMFFSFGYIFQMKFIGQYKRVRTKNGEITPEYRKEYAFVIFTLFYVLMNLFVYTSVDLFSIFDIWKRILASLASPLETYQNSLYSTITSPFILLLVVISPIYYFGIIWLLVRFGRLRSLNKIAVCLVLFLDCSRWILQGKNKGIFDVLFLLVSVFMVVNAQNNIKINGSKSAYKGVIYTLVSIIIISVCLAYFNNAIISRKEFFSNYYSFKDNIIVTMFPDFMTPLLVNITDYLTQGYHSFSYIFEVDWVPMYGLGSGRVLIDNFSILVGRDLFLDTYQYRLADFGIDPFVNWHSAYAWIANDVHWIGVIFVMFIFGMLYADSWVSSIYDNKISSHVMFYFLSLTIIYIPANTQVLMQTSTFFSFSIFIIARLFKNVRINIK